MHTFGKNRRYSPVLQVGDGVDDRALLKHQRRWCDPVICFKALALMAVASFVSIIIITTYPSEEFTKDAIEMMDRVRDLYEREEDQHHGLTGKSEHFRMHGMHPAGFVAMRSPNAMSDSSAPPPSPVEILSAVTVESRHGHGTDRQLPHRFSFQECFRVPDDEKFDCCPDYNSCTPDSCVARQCCWTSLEAVVRTDDLANEREYIHFVPQPGSFLSVDDIALANKTLQTMMATNQPESKSEADKLYIQNFYAPLNNVSEWKFPWNKKPSTPWCYFPADTGGYTLRWLKETKFGFRGLLELTGGAVRYENELKQLMLEIFIESDYRVHLRIADVEKKRFIAPYPILTSNEKLFKDVKSTRYRVIIRQHQPFSFAVQRIDTQEIIFDTKLNAPLIFADQFIEFSARLSTNYVYGLGEHVDRIKHTFEWDRFIMWNSDGWPAELLPLYGTQPFYLALESSGKAHGVYFHNLNAMDVLLRPQNSLTWRTIGGVIDLYFFMGPSPADVVAQYTELVGRPFFPPYWSLGYHLCRYGYGTLERTRYINSINREAGIPVEVQWNDIDYMNRWKDFTYDDEKFHGLPEFVDGLHRDQLKYMIITDPGISAAEKPGSYTPFDLGRDADVFVKNDTDDILIGLVWTGNWTVWPDFTHPNIDAYWTRVIGDFHANISFDGLWIDMNEPSNFGIGSKDGCPWASKYEHPPYLPPLRFPSLAAKTICMTAKQYKGIHYNLHNAYGLTESISTFNALNATFKGRARPFVVSRSNFAGSGKYSASWNGDAGASWHDMRASITYLLNFNMFGIPMAGADICGFHSNTTVELCARWSQLGAFYTFARNHNDLAGSDQDPASMGPVVVAAARQALQMRYQLLPHFYTQLYEAHVHGATVARPLFFEFPRDPIAKICDWQFLIGSALLVVPVLAPNKTTVTAYLPPDDRWYDLYTGEMLLGDDESGWVTLQAPMDKINLVQRGASVIVQQMYANSTAVMRLKPFFLSVALSADDKAAVGSLFWDSGDGYEAFGAEEKYNLIEFYADKRRLVTKVVHAGYADQPMSVASVRVSGLEQKPKRVSINGKICAEFVWDADLNVLQITTADQIDLLRPLTVTYT